MHKINNKKSLIYLEKVKFSFINLNIEFIKFYDFSRNIHHILLLRFLYKLRYRHFHPLRFKTSISYYTKRGLKYTTI